MRQLSVSAENRIHFVQVNDDDHHHLDHDHHHYQNIENYQYQVLLLHLYVLCSKKLFADTNGSNMVIIMSNGKLLLTWE
jgi:hypothetical protein